MIGDNNDDPKAIKAKNDNDHRVIQIFVKELEAMKLLDIPRDKRCCHYCNKKRTNKHKLYKCKGCKLGTFCNRSCQKKKWEEHRECCKIYNRMRRKNNDDRRAIKVKEDNV